MNRYVRKGKKIIINKLDDDDENENEVAQQCNKTNIQISKINWIYISIVQYTILFN